MSTIELYECLDGVWRPLSEMSKKDIENNPEAKERILTDEDLINSIGKAFFEGFREGFDRTTYQYSYKERGWKTYREVVSENQDELKKRIKALLKSIS